MAAQKQLAMNVRLLWVSTILGALSGTAMLRSEWTTSSGTPNQLRSQPAGATVRVWQDTNPPGWSTLGSTPLLVSDYNYSRRVGLFLWGHRPSLHEKAPTGVVRLAPTPAYLALLACPWLVSLGSMLAWWAGRQQSGPAHAVQAEPESKVPGGVEPGDKLGPYWLEKRIGEGAQGEVFLARDDQGQELTVKVMSASLTRDRESRTRFEREVDVGTRLDHPNVIRTLRWSISDGRYWMAQPYYAGGSLASQITPGLAEAQIIAWMRDICAGLAYAHGQHTIHRDLKPQNILLDASGRAVVADFGLARGARYETITGDSTVLGTPGYMAPEQVQGQPVTALSDLYSLGVIGFELVNGSRPFHGELIQVLMAHISQPPPPLRPDISNGLKEVITRLLDKDPSRRFPSATQVDEALAHACP